ALPGRKRASLAVRKNLLTRVTKIFQKSVLAEIASEARAVYRAALCCAGASAPARSALFRLTTRARSKRYAISKGPKRKSGRSGARIAQSHDGPHAGFTGGACRGDRSKTGRVGGERRHRRNSHLHGSACTCRKGRDGRYRLAADRKAGRQRCCGAGDRGRRCGRRSHRDRGGRLGEGGRYARFVSQHTPTDPNIFPRYFQETLHWRPFVGHCQRHWVTGADSPSRYPAVTL